MVKDPSANVGDIGDMGSISGSGKIPWRRAWQPTPVFLPGESHGQRSLEATAHGVAKSQKQLKWMSTEHSRVKCGKKTIGTQFTENLS